MYFYSYLYLYLYLRFGSISVFFWVIDCSLQGAQAQLQPIPFYFLLLQPFPSPLKIPLLHVLRSIQNNAWLIRNCNLPLFKKDENEKDLKITTTMNMMTRKMMRLRRAKYELFWLLRTSSLPALLVSHMIMVIIYWWCMWIWICIHTCICICICTVFVLYLFMFNHLN